MADPRLERRVDAFISSALDQAVDPEAAVLERIVALEKEKLRLQTRANRPSMDHLRQRLLRLEDEVAQLHLATSVDPMAGNRTTKEIEPTPALGQLLATHSVPDRQDADQHRRPAQRSPSSLNLSFISGSYVSSESSESFDEQATTVTEKTLGRSRKPSQPLCTLPNALNYDIKLRDDSSGRSYRMQSKLAASIAGAKPQPAPFGRSARQQSIRAVTDQLQKTMVRPMSPSFLAKSSATPPQDEFESASDNDSLDSQESLHSLSSVTSSDPMNATLEFVIVEADWNVLTSQSTPTPLLPPTCSWRYPTTVNEKVNNTQHVQDQSFFFPSGVKIDVVGMGVKELRTQSFNHRRHVVPFTDRRGRPLYACCLTVYSAYSVSSLDAQTPGLSIKLGRLLELDRAARRIQLHYRRHADRRRTMVWNMASSRTSKVSTPVPHTPVHHSIFHYHSSTASNTSEPPSSLVSGPGSASKPAAQSQPAGFFSKFFRRASATPTAGKSMLETSSQHGLGNTPGRVRNNSLPSMPVEHDDLPDALAKEEKMLLSPHPMPIPIPSTVMELLSDGLEPRRGSKNSRDSKDSRGSGQGDNHTPAADISKALRLEVVEAEAGHTLATVAEKPFPCYDNQAEETVETVAPTTDSIIEAANAVVSEEERQRVETERLRALLEGRCVVAQKAYCLITPVPEYTFIFTVLDIIAEAEQRLCEALDASCTLSPTEVATSRARFLAQVQGYFRDSIAPSALVPSLQDIYTNFSVPRGALPMSPNSVLERYLMTATRKGSSFLLVPSPPHPSPAPGRHGNNASQMSLLSMASAARMSRSSALEDCKLKVRHYSPPLRIDRQALLTTKEWSLAVLATHLSTPSVFKVINLLLLEKSLVIYGANPGIVTAVTLGVHNLIAPFAWEGIFIPLVPDSARELFNAPVPLIIGTVSPPKLEDVTEGTAVLYLSDDTLALGSSGSAVMTAGEYAVKFASSARPSVPLLPQQLLLQSGDFQSYFARLPEVSADLMYEEDLFRRCERLKRALGQYALPQLHVSTPAPMDGGVGGGAKPGTVVQVKNTLDRLLMANMPAGILRQVRVLLVLFKKHNYHFVHTIMKDQSSYKKFVKPNHVTQEDEFFPDQFLEPLRCAMEFQEAVVHTQLFVSFVDKLRKQSTVLDDIRRFIGQWIVRQVRRRRHTQTTTE